MMQAMMEFFVGEHIVLFILSVFFLIWLEIEHMKLKEREAMKQRRRERHRRQAAIRQMTYKKNAERMVRNG